MAEIQINSFFTRGGQPAIDINGTTPGFPTIRIWEVDGSTYNLVIGAPSGSAQNTDGFMTEVIDSGQSDGFYSFTFSDLLSFDERKKYLIRVDGGPSFSAGERYQAADLSPNPSIDVEVSIDNETITDIADATTERVWDEPTAMHVTPGTTGFALNQIRAGVESIAMSIVDLTDLVNLVLKYDTNRTKIDTVTKQLIVYDNDCTTVLRIFQLLDSTGTPSTDAVCERVPVAASDGNPVCT